MLELAQDREIIDPHIRNIPSALQGSIGMLKRARTLIHHYKTDKKGIITEAT